MAGQLGSRAGSISLEGAPLMGGQEQPEQAAAAAPVPTHAHTLHPLGPGHHPDDTKSLATLARRNTKRRSLR